MIEGDKSLKFTFTYINKCVAMHLIVGIKNFVVGCFNFVFFLVDKFVNKYSQNSQKQKDSDYFQMLNVFNFNI